MSVNNTKANSLNITPGPGGAFSSNATRLANQASPVRTLKEDQSMPDAGDALNIQMSKVHPRGEVGIKVTRRVSQTFMSPERNDQVHTDHMINPNSNMATKMLHQDKLHTSHKGYMMSDRSIDQSAMLKQIHNVAIQSASGEAIDATKSVQYKAAMQKQTRENYLTNLYDNTVGSKTNLLQKHFNKDITTMYFSMREQAGVSSPKRVVGTLESQNNFETADNKTDKDSETQGGRDDNFKDNLKDIKNPRVDLSIKSIKKSPMQVNQQKLGTAPMSPISPYSRQFSTGEEPPMSSYLNRDQITSIDSRAVLETLKQMPTMAGQQRMQPLALPKLEGEQMNLLNRQMYPSPVADSLSKRIRSPPGPYDSIRLNSCSRNQYSFENSQHFKAEAALVPPITTRLHQVSLRSGSHSKNHQGGPHQIWGLRSSDTTTDNQLTIKNFNQRKPFAVELQQNKQEFASNRVGLRTRGPQYYDQLLKSHDGVLLMSKSGEKHLTQADAYGGLVSEDMQGKKGDVQYSAQFGSGEFINNEQQFLVKVQPLDSRGAKQTGQLFPEESPRYQTDSVKVDSAGNYATQAQTAHGIFSVPSSQPNKMSKNQRTHRHSNHVFSADKKQRQKTVGPVGLSIQHRYKRPDRFHIESITGPGKDTLQLSFREEVTTSHPQTQRDHNTNTNNTDRSVHLPMSARMNDSMQGGAIASQNQSTSAIDYQLSLNKQSPFGPVSPDGNFSPRTANRQSDQCFPSSPKKSMMDKQFSEQEAPTLQSSVLTTDERRRALNQVQSTKNVQSSKNPMNGKAFHQTKLPTMACEDVHAVRRKQNEQLMQAIKQVESQIKQRRRDVIKQADKKSKGRKTFNKQLKLHARIQQALEQQITMQHQSGSFESKQPVNDSLFDEVPSPLIDQSEVEGMRNSFPEINEPVPIVETREMNQTGQHPNLRSFGDAFTAGEEQFNTPVHNQQKTVHPSLNINQLGDSTTLFKAIDSNASMNNFGRHSNISSQLVQTKGLDPDNSDLNRLYRVKFQQDMDNVKLRTQEQILSNQTLKDNYALKVEYYRVANLQLARSIRTIKELADKQQMDRHKKDAAEQRRLFHEGAGMNPLAKKKTFEEHNDQNGGEFPETVSVNTGSLMNQSAMSPGRKPKGGSSDIKRVEKIIMHVPQIMNSKKPIDGILAALKTMKAALGKVCAKLTLFIADKPLQRLIFQGTARMQRYYKTLSLENKPYYGIYLDESDYAAPTFSTEKQARMVQLQPSVIQLPFFDRDGGLQMIFQAIQDQTGTSNKSRLIKGKKSGSIGAVSRERGQSHMSGKESGTNRHSVLSHGSGNTNNKKRWFVPGFVQSDFLIARIIAMMSKININIFENRYYAREKVILQKKLLQFTNRLLGKKTVKEVIRMIKTEIPDLLGYKQCQVFVGAKENNQMYTVSVEKDESENQESVFCGIPMKYIEQEYVCPENRVVRFPENLGYSGYAYTKNSILFINDFSYKLKENVTQLIGQVPAFQKHLFTRMGFAFIGGLMARDVNYASKIDNFIEYKDIRNFLFSSLEDETFVGYPKPVGVIQLYDRKEKNIDYEDYARIFYMRKLLGSVLIRGGEYTEALQTLTGIELNEDSMNNLLKGSDTLASNFGNEPQLVGMAISFIRKTVTDQHKRAEPVLAELEALAQQQQKVGRSRSPIKTQPLEDKDKEKTVEQ